MTAFERYRLALPTSFRIHLALLALSMVPAYLAAASARALTSQHPLGDPILTAPGLAPLLEAFTPIATSGFGIGSIVTAFLAALVTLGLTPWLLMSWCSSMHPTHTGSGDEAADPPLAARPRSPWREGWRHYISAFLTSLMLAPLPLVAFGWAALVPLVLDIAGAELTPAMTLGLASVPAIGVWVLWGALHDLARAGLVHGEGVWKTAGRALAGPRWRRLASYCAWSGLGLLAALTASVAAFLADGPSMLQSALAVCLGQGLLFARTLARARWLASAVHSMNPNTQT